MLLREKRKLGRVEEPWQGRKDYFALLITKCNITLYDPVVLWHRGHSEYYVTLHMAVLKAKVRSISLLSGFFSGNRFKPGPS